MSPDGSPIERFLQFVPNIGHKGIDMLTTILELFEMYDIDIMNCRRQSYDNASNMSGKYNGLQARIKEINPRACFVPCSANCFLVINYEQDIGRVKKRKRQHGENDTGSNAK